MTLNATVSVKDGVTHLVYAHERLTAFDGSRAGSGERLLLWWSYQTANLHRLRMWARRCVRRALVDGCAGAENGLSFG
jgi:hypothetical protein